MDNANFHTPDIQLSSTLSTLGYKIKDIDRTDKKRQQFIFENTEELKETVKKYWNKELTTEPQKLFGELKYLKSRIFFEK